MDVTSVVAEISGATASVTAIGVASLAVFVAIAVIRWVRRAI